MDGAIAVGFLPAMKRDGVRQPDHSVMYWFELAGERWNLLLLRELVQGRRCYESMCVDLGIARNVLAARLRSLVDEGIVEKVKYQERPDRYEYRLTPKGEGLVPVVLALDAWASRCDCTACAA
ncbi:MAG: hypothetical protein RI900_446 [Actinomycetota bacterium]|jgi:DNA-binding HxlR family transcriptional regulator